MPLVIGLGTLAITGAIFAGVALRLAGKPDDSGSAQAAKPGESSRETTPAGFESVLEPRIDGSLPPQFPSSERPLSPGVQQPNPPPSPAENVKVDTLPRLRLLWERPQGGPKISRLNFTADGKYLLATAYDRSEVAVFDPETGAAVGRAFTGHDTKVLGVAPLPGGQVISVAGDRNFGLVWDPATLKVSGRVFCPPVPVKQPESFVYTSANGRYLLCGGTESDTWRPSSFALPIRVTDIETGKLVASVPMSWGMGRFTADSTRLVVLHDKTGSMQVIHLESGKVESEVQAEGDMSAALAIAVSPDGKYAVFRVSDQAEQRKFNVYEVGTGRYVATIPVPHTGGFRTCFSPNGKWLTIVHKDPNYGNDSQVVLVDTATWTPVAQAFVTDTRQIQWDHGMRFSPDGTRLVVPTNGGVMMAFEVPSDPSALAQEPDRAKGKGPWAHVDLGRGRLIGNVVRLPSNSRITLRDPPAGAFEMAVEARTEKYNIRLYGAAGAEVIFNWEGKPDELRVHRPSNWSSIAKYPVTPLTPGRWYSLRWRVTEREIDVWVDERLIYAERGSYDLSKRAPFQVGSMADMIEVKSFTVSGVK